MDTETSNSPDNMVFQQVHRVVFGIGGMTCSACVNTIQKQVDNYFTQECVAKGIVLKLCNVTLITEEGVVEYTTDVNVESASISPLEISNQLKEVVEDCGFDCNIMSDQIISKEDLSKSSSSSSTSVKTVHLHVYGMTCAACTNSIEDALSQLAGVVSCSVQLVTQECEVTYDHNKQTIRDIVATIEDCGFDCSLQEDTHQDQQLQILQRVKEIKYWANSAIKASICSVTIMFLYMFIPMIIMKTRHQKMDSMSSNMPMNDGTPIADNTGNMSDQQYKHAYGHARNGVIGTFPYVQVGIPGLYLSDIIGLSIASYVQFYLGKNFYKSSFAALKHYTGTMDTLVCLSTSIVYIFSVVSMLRNMIISDRLENENNSTNKIMPNVLFETSCMLISFISIGKYLENKAKARTSTALSKFMTMTPTNCLLYDIETKTSNEIDVKYLETNDLVEIKPGMRIPCDGVIVEGESELDESIITGESHLIYKTANDHVIQGSINGHGHFIFKALQVGESTKLSQIIKVMKLAQLSKAPIQKYADYIASRFVPAVLVTSTLTFVSWVLICKFITVPQIFQQNENGYLYMCFQIAMSVIVVACPCALGLAAPTSVIVGTGVAANNGVLLKGGEILQNVSELDCFVFDKTGTLTTGEMSVETFKKNEEALNEEFALNTLWELCYLVENLSEHPIAKSIVRYTSTKIAGHKLATMSQHHQIASQEIIMGQGMKAVVHCLGANEKDYTEYSVLIGNMKLFQDSPALQKSIEQSMNIDNNANAKSQAFVAINNKFVGTFLVEDSYKKDGPQIINYLLSKKYDVYMCTGDNKNAALKTAADLGIPFQNVYYEVSPVEKANIIKGLQTEHTKKVGFVGDGINDSVALVQADIGISVSNGTDMAMEASDIVLLQNLTTDTVRNDDMDVGIAPTTRTSSDNSLKGLIYAIDISIKTFNKIKSNFFWSVLYNALMLPIAMGFLVPFHISLHPMFAGAAMICSSISVVLNSLLLKRWRKPEIENIRMPAKSAATSSFFEQGKHSLAKLLTFFNKSSNRDRAREEDEGLVVNELNPSTTEIEMEQV